MNDESQDDEGPDDPATMIANAVSDCHNAAAMMVSPRLWRWQWL